MSIKDFVVRSEQSFELSVKMNRSTAEWLMGYMQNPTDENEGIYCRALRKNLFCKIKTHLDLKQ